jgi:hypothetical protein
MINFFFADFAKVVFAFLLALSQSSAKTASHVSMLNPGNEIDGMTLTAGAADARPLWAFCASEVSNNVTTANCQVPQMPKLAIGHVFLGIDEALSETEWSELKWELSIDNRQLNLEKFGTYDYVLPTMAPNPSLIREVFMKFTAWDIVLTDPQPGSHTIRGRVYTDAEEYSWMVNLVIEDRPASLEPSPNDKDSQDSQSQCPQSVRRLSRFHHSCRFYGLKLEAIY